MTRLEQLRVDLGWTPEQLGERASISGMTIRRIEAGKPATPKTLKKLADCLGVAASELAREAFPNRSAA